MALFRALVDSFHHASSAPDTTRELLTTLLTLGETKAKALELELKDDLRTAETQANPRLPIETIIQSHTEIRAYTNASAPDIGAVVNTALKQLLRLESHEIAGLMLITLTSMLGTALTTFFGQSTPSTGVFRQYYLLQHLGGFVRMDVAAWYHAIHATALQKHVDKLTVVVATCSLLDLRRISLSTLLHIYSAQLAAPNANLSHDEIQQVLAAAKAILDR